MLIEILSLTAAGEHEIFVSFKLTGAEGSECKRFLISDVAYIELGLQRGESTREQYEQVEYESEVYVAYKRGLAILGFGGCSERMLASKLINKGIEKKIALRAVARLRDKGFVNERENACREAERTAVKLWGESRIRAHLRSRGYRDESVDAAMFFLEDGGVDFDKNCIAVVESKCKHLPQDKLVLQKLIASVCRYGYSFAQVKSAIATIADRKEDIYRM